MANRDYSNLVAINDFRDPQEYIYNSDLLEFTQFGIRLKDLVPTNIAAGATFTKDYFLNYSNDDIFAAPYIFGTVTIENERLALIGGCFNKQWTLPLKEEKKVGQDLPKGEIHFTYYPNYSNCPQTTQQIFTFGRIPDDDNKKNVIEFQHTSTGDFLFNLYDKAGNVQTTNIQKTIEYANSPISFAISWDTATAPALDRRVKFNFFMDEESLVKYDLDVESFNIDKITEFALGNMIGSFKPNFSIKNFVVLKDCPNIAAEFFIDPEDRLFPLSETRYTTVPQKCEPLFALEMEALKSITTETNNSDEVDRGFYVAFTFKINSTEYFFDRQDLKWKIHNAPEDISDLGYMLAYKDDLIQRDGIQFKCIPYLRSIKGENTPSIVSQTITYDQFVPYTEEAPTALIYGYVRDSLGNFIRNAKVVVTPSRAAVAETGNFILAELTKSVRTGSNGYWDMQLPLSSNFVPEILYNFQILYRDKVVFEIANIRVSAEGTIKFEDLISGHIPPSPTPPGPGPEPTPPDPDHYIKGMWWQEIPDVPPTPPKEGEEDDDYEQITGEG